MHSNVEWILEMTVNPGRLDDLQALMAELVAYTQANEPGTLIYEFCLSPDSTVCHVHERYADSDAAMVHITTFGQRFAQRFFTDLTTTRCVVYGSPSDAVRQAIAASHPMYLSVAAGFMR